MSRVRIEYVSGERHSFDGTPFDASDRMSAWRREDGSVVAFPLYNIRRIEVWEAESE